MNDRPTLGAVAQRAGVSLKTASRAMNGEYGVATATSERVHAAARALGFRPNQLARTLAAGGPSAAVGMVIPSVSDPFIALVVGAVEEVLAPRDLNLMTASHHDDNERQRRLIRGLVDRRVDALIVIPAPGDASYVAPEIAHGLAVVSLDRPLPCATPVDTVVIDNVAAADAAVSELVRSGHRRIGALGSDDRLWTLQQRLEGYRNALARHGLPVDPELVEFACRTDVRARAEAERMLSLADPPTAFFSAQHVTSRGLMRAVQFCGRDVDLAMVDEVVDADLLSVRPRVAVASGPHRLGHIGATLALERLDSQTLASVPARAARQVVLPALHIGVTETYRAPTVAQSLADLAAASGAVSGDTRGIVHSSAVTAGVGVAS